jgi:membrane protein required for colicin V production
VDLVVISILALATARGLWRGLVREAFSLAALAAAILAVWQLGATVTEALDARLGATLPPVAVQALAVAGLALATLVAVAVIGRIVRRSVQLAGLGLFDRVAGGCVGALEGVLVASLLLGGATLVLERDHPWLASSQSLVLMERARARISGEAEPAPRDVAAPSAARH